MNWHATAGPSIPPAALNDLSPPASPSRQPRRHSRPPRRAPSRPPRPAQLSLFAAAPEVPVSFLQARRLQLSGCKSCGKEGSLDDGPAGSHSGAVALHTHRNAHGPRCACAASFRKSEFQGSLFLPRSCTETQCPRSLRAPLHLGILAQESTFSEQFGGGPLRAMVASNPALTFLFVFTPFEPGEIAWDS